jgi:uncharacterized repeat protein (TIGR03803 family)
LLLVLVTAGSAQVVSTLYSFTGKNTSAYPVYVTPTQGQDGALYGTTSDASVTTGGSVFRLTTSAAASFPHVFDSSSGTDPFGGVTLSIDGSFYGTTGFGGSANDGVLFRITPGGGYTVLHEFQGGADGALPGAPPIEGTDGGLYGTTNGSTSTPATIYKYTRSSASFSTIYQFDQAQGQLVTSPLVQATDGNLYGTAFQGGASNCGTIFEVTTSGTYYSFPCGQGGANPIGPLVQATDGNFYGTTSAGGSNGLGTVVKLDKSGVVSVLHSFQGNPTDGASPFAGLVQATDGKLYGATSGGGASNVGSLFQITTAGSYKLLHSLGTLTGNNPVGTLSQHTNGMLYGTTEFGGKSGFGTVYSLDMSLGPFVALVHYQGRVGNTARILGQGLTGTSSVTFNGVSATSFNVLRDTYMTAVVPSGATTGPVVVTTPGGALTSNKKFRIIGGTASAARAKSGEPISRATKKTN